MNLVGDRASYNGKKGVICRDRMNGMIDLALDFEGKAPKVFRSEYTCGGTISCIYKDELDKPEETCVKCRQGIFTGDGRYHFGGGANTHCEACGDKADADALKTGIIL